MTVFLAGIDGAEAGDACLIQHLQRIIVAGIVEVHAMVIYRVDHLDAAFQQNVHMVGRADKGIHLVQMRSALREDDLQVRYRQIVRRQILLHQGEGPGIALFVNHRMVGVRRIHILDGITDGAVAHEGEQHLALADRNRRRRRHRRCRRPGCRRLLLIAGSDGRRVAFAAGIAEHKGLFPRSLAAGNLQLRQIHPDAGAQAHVRAGIARPADMAVIAHQRQMIRLGGLDCRGEIGAAAVFTHDQPALADCIGRTRRMAAGLVIPLGRRKAILRIEEFLIVQDEQARAVVLRDQHIADRIGAEHGIDHHRVDPGEHIALLKAGDAAVIILLDLFRIALEDHLLGVDHVFRDQQRLIVLNRQHAP